MNKRIKELYNQSLEEKYQYGGSGAKPGEVYSNYITVLNPEKFAELIVRECCQGLIIDDVIDIHAKFGLECKPDFGKIPDYADLFTYEEWVEHTISGAILLYDGSGYWSTETQESNWSVWVVEKPEWATHVTWYNK